MADLETATVFVVDDEPETRDSFAALASSLALKVETYASGEEFLDNLDVRSAGCAVVDFRLPGLDGIQLHRRLVEAGCRLPVILISGYMTVRSAAEGLEQGIFRVLEKPYRDDELARAICEAIQRDDLLRRQRTYRLDLKHGLESLDERERQTLELILAGHPNKVIERRLRLSRRTVERTRSSILAKTKLQSFIELSAACGEMKAVDPDSPSPIGMDVRLRRPPPLTGHHAKSPPVPSAY